MTKEKLNRLPLRFFDQNKAGEILSRVTSDLDKIADVLQTGLLKLIVAIGTIIGSLIVMFYYSVPLTCIFLLFMAANMVITRIVGHRPPAFDDPRRGYDPVYGTRKYYRAG